MSRLTKQGVRDLNHLPGKSKGRKLPDPPRPMPATAGCTHPTAFEEVLPDGGSYCNLCGKTFDWDGFSY